MAQQIGSWSYSKLQDFEKCRLLAKLKHLDRIPEPERQLKPGQTEHANDRGTRIHTSCENYINGSSDFLDLDADKHFGPQIDLLRVMHADGLVSLEGEWGMNRDWEPTAWKTAWLRLKLDAMVMHDKHTATVIDFKTGRKFGNEAKHAEQLALYQLVAFLRYPHLETVSAELWYLDQPTDNVTKVMYTRAKGLLQRPQFNRRGVALTSCTDWKPNPNVHSCKYCQYGPWNGGQCQWVCRCLLVPAANNASAGRAGWMAATRGASRKAVERKDLPVRLDRIVRPLHLTLPRPGNA